MKEVTLAISGEFLNSRALEMLYEEGRDYDEIRKYILGVMGVPKSEEAKFEQTVQDILLGRSIIKDSAEANTYQVVPTKECPNRIFKRIAALIHDREHNLKVISELQGRVAGLLEEYYD